MPPSSLTSQSVTSNTDISRTLRVHWLAELIRLREAHWGPIDDADAVRRASQAGGDLQTRILTRATILADREKLSPMVDSWYRSATGIFIVLIVLAAVSGASVALGALGDGTRPVNVLWAIGALLGLHLLTFFIWLASFTLRPAAVTGLGRLWLWITRKFARGPDAALVPQALLNLLARTGALRWLFGAISHLLWLVGLSAALIALLAVLSTASYRFVWATTLLEPDTFVRLTHAIGWLPAQFGFALPDAAMVRISDGAQILPAQAQVQWSVWLIGVLVVYGILPRLLAWLLCIAMTFRSQRALKVDLSLPGFAALRDRLQPPAQSIGIDRPVQPLHEPRVAHVPLIDFGEQAVLVGLELPSDLAWPPPSLPASARDAGNLDTREQRNRVLDALTQSAASRLLIACDACQTPDRGTLSLIAELAGKAGQTRVWLSTRFGTGVSNELEPERFDTWRSRLEAAGLPKDAVMLDADNPLRWLDNTHD